MTLEHVAIRTSQLERLKAYYVKYFNGIPNEIYINPVTNFSSYFLSFQSGARLEIMQRPGIPPNRNDTKAAQHEGIIHLAFGVENMEAVDEKARLLEESGFPILRGPRKTGDGYYEFETLDPDNNRLEVTTKFIS